MLVILTFLRSSITKVKLIALPIKLIAFQKNVLHIHAVIMSLTAPPSMGLFKPRWNGESWEEGATQEYIDSLKPEPQEPSIEEKNRADIIYLAVMTGVDL